jgi:hypothetical protein
VGIGLNLSNQALFDNGTAAAPSITFDSDTNTGIYRSSSDQLSLITAGTDQFTISTSAIVTPLQMQVTANAGFTEYSFSNDTNTGVEWIATDTVGFTAGGNTAFSASSASAVNQSLYLLRPTTDNAVACGDSTHRWTAVFAVNGTIQTSHSSTKEILGYISEDTEIPDGIMFKRPGSDRIHVGFLADNLPQEAFYEDGVSVETSAPIGVLCVKLKQAFKEIENLKQQVQLLLSK